MGFRTIIINKHCKLSYKNNHLLYKSAFETEAIHLQEIDILILETTDISLSTMLIKRLIDENVLIIFCDDKRLPICKMTAYYGRHDSSLQINKQINWNEDLKANIWTEIISQKIVNQATFLNKIGMHNKSESLLTLKDKLAILDPTNREGHAARIYFNTLFGNDFTRELDCDINAALNYGYQIILSIFAREIVKCGCLSQLGLKHSNQFNDFNLASDLMEPFRILVDMIVYHNKDCTFNHIKVLLFNLFVDTFTYENKSMYLTNIINSYVRKIIDNLNENINDIPIFTIVEE
ncbi:MAG: type II CRISPR-associated endonuclease Cas1 [Bacilli bacterium]|jgi:CRISPR-associated endonuclease Cas1 subtype II|nr:type II CRISPR-associated endonuclease Cas1 [Bacilli bacterium]